MTSLRWFSSKFGLFWHFFIYLNVLWDDMLRDGTIINVALGLGLIYSALVVVFCKKIAACLGVMDHPGAQEHKSHTAPTPLVGGLVALPPVIAILLLQMLQEGMSSTLAASYLAIAFATIASLIVGFLDDRSHIPALFRLIICSGIFGLAISTRPDFIVSTLDLQGIGLQIELGLIAIPFSVFCLLGFQNSVNMADGRNGLVSGVVIIWLLALLSFGWHPLTLAIVSLLIGMFIVLGANLGGRIFLGDAGTYGIGAFIGLATIWIHRLNIGLHTIDVLIMFMVPALDMVRLFAYRIFAGRNPFSADHDHLHHYLDRSIGWPLGRKMYYALVALPIMLSKFDAIGNVNALILGFGLYALAIAVTTGSQKPN